MISPELTAQLAEVVEAGVAEAIAGREAEMQERYDQMIQAHQAGYRDGDIWRRAQLDRDRFWLDAIIRFQARENHGSARWRLLQELARTAERLFPAATIGAVRPAEPDHNPTTPQEPTDD